MIILVPNNEKFSETHSRKHRVLTGSLLFFLGALAGSASAFLSYKVVLGWFRIIFSLPFILVCLILGAFFGIGATVIADEHNRLRWVALAVAALARDGRARWKNRKREQQYSKDQRLSS